MSDRPADDAAPESAPAQRFVSRERPTGPGLGRDDRTADLLVDMTRLFDSAARIASRGEEAFNDPVDDTGRLAAEAIIIRLAEIASRLPESFRSAHPHQSWNALRAVRNRLSHDYRSVDAAIIWEVLHTRLPEFRSALDI